MEYPGKSVARTAAKGSTESSLLDREHPIQLPQPRPAGVEGLWLLWARRSFLARATGLGIVLSLAVAFLIPPKYTATARLMPPDNQNNSGLLSALMARGGPSLGLLAGGMLNVRSSSALFVGILRSRTVQDSLIQRFDLRRVYGTKYWLTARTALEENTDITEDRINGIITISVEDKDPQRAAAMAGEYVKQLDELVNQLSTSSAHRERVFLESRLQAVKQELDAAAKDFSEFSSKNTTIDVKEQGKAMVDAAASLQGELIATQTQLQGLRTIYTDDNIRVRALRARATELQRQLEKLGGKPQSESSAPEADSIYPSIRKLPLLGVTWADLYRRMQVQETVYELLTQQYELAKVEEAKEIPTVRVLDQPEVPERKSSPKRLMILLAGTLLFFGGAVAWVFCQETWRQVDPDDPLRLLAAEVTETTAQATASPRRFLRRFRSARTNSAQSPDEQQGH